MSYVYVVIDDLPPDFGERNILNIFSNKKAANCEVKCYKQLDDYKNQYIKIKRYHLKDKATMIPVKNRK